MGTAEPLDQVTNGRRQRAGHGGARVMDGSEQGPQARGGRGPGLGCWWRTAREFQGRG